MSFSDDLLIMLSHYSCSYPVLRKALYERRKREGRARAPHLFDCAARTMISRLKNKGFVRKKGALWRITCAGNAYLSRRIAILHRFTGSSPNNAQKNLIITFDIPEKHRKKRDWLRVELRSLNFRKLQKSVWLGPGPLPAYTLDSLRKMRLLPYLKFFEAKESDIV